MRNVCIIGGSRYFGLHLVSLFRDAGAAVTLVNRGSAAPPPGVDHVRADRSDEAALAAALGDRTFDAVVDQVLYTPVQAAVACRVFAGRTPRYVMTSTMEVYDPATSPLLAAADAPVTEDLVDPAAWAVDPDLPWHDPEALARYFDAATAYAEGKRQAEAVLARSAPFSWASVRSAHVLGGGDRDFTGRLAHYVERIAAGRPVAVHRDARPTSFVHHREIAAVLARAAASEATGPLNACSHGSLTAVGLSELIAERLGTTARYRTADGADVSPYSFDRAYAMDNGRAAALGFPFSRTADWLPGAVDEAAAAVAGKAL
ncbi:NAD-dependent epimerase/dehydratase family protein [Streptomyces sp. NRRL B-24484]|uniref:NAD-dependent epimerase/dehydratase family protein n=1 Tax=Streptomyces sp. NRRL B-24484 TaxID=1463833 RepID=UPI0004C288AE|nr:NAD-dependent epimerase/dehydratase family protein [Streptomyces sp. NRRL B-24484]